MPLFYIPVVLPKKVGVMKREIKNDIPIKKDMINGNKPTKEILTEIERK
jgi:hypothetical protein